MAKKKPVRASKTSKPNRSPAWEVFLRLDPDLERAKDRYLAMQEYTPTNVQLFERALKLLFTNAGCWPLDPEAPDGN